LINVKEVNNSLLDPNGWRGWTEDGFLAAHKEVSEDYNYLIALILATEELKPPISSVTLKELQEECVRCGIAKSGTKPDLLARLQAHDAQ
jgi:hypothetical protein